MQSFAIAPRNCVLGEGAVEEVGKLAVGFGRRAVILGGTTALKVAYERVTTALDREGVMHNVSTFTGECSQRRIDAAARLLADCDVAVCIGGGKVLDTGKAATQVAGIACITVPTSAATCAACTALSILHTDAGGYETGQFLDRCPEAMIIDPELIITAPPRLLAAGVADALARATETELAARVGLPSTHAALSLGVGRGYWGGLLEEEAGRALSACRAGRVTSEFERVVEASILGAGLASGLCGGFFHLSVAHAISYALTYFIRPEDALHGETVGLGILVQRLLEDSSGRTMERTRYQFDAWGLPLTFGAIKFPEVMDDAGRALAERTYTYLDREHAIPFSVTKTDLSQAIVMVESY